ncbi:MAG: galactokinase [Balneolaceae bacterium]|nr:galactokinase [Balneolaceae bacterium]
MSEVRDRVRSVFDRQFGGRPMLVRSPGRINIIGEHTDYNSGWVLPAAIDRSLLFGLRPNEQGRGRFYAVDKQEGYETSLGDVLTRSSLEWANYLMGVISVMQNRDVEIPGLDVAFSGNVPVGAGLSSSAALTAGFAFGLNELFGLGIGRESLARIAQKAENDFVGMKCGVMDPFVNLLACKGHAMKLDCRTLDYEQIPLEDGDLAFVLFDSRVQRELTTSEYNKRRRQCEEGVSVLQARGERIQALRDADEAMLERHQAELDPVIHRRLLFVVRENERVHRAGEALGTGDGKKLGRLMNDSHYGLRDLYEVTCEETDFLAEEAAGLDGVLGSRQMGGGFGGCTLNLVRREALEEISARMIKAYEARFNRGPGVYTVNSSEGTEVLD